MRKYLLIIGIVAIAIGCNNAFATGDKQITSKTYVENQLATKQDKIPAVDTNTVITHTGTNGEIGQKAIYDSGENYVSQQTALMTAGDANTGINNALENEFICIEEDTDHTCLIWQIKNSYQQQILPTGYTALEYIESTGTQYLNLGQPIGSGENITTKFEYTADARGIWFGARAGNSLSAGFVFEYQTYANTLYIIPQNTTVTANRGYYVMNLSLMTPYIVNWYGNPLQTPTLSPTKTFINNGNYLNESNYLFTPPYNAYLFAYNLAGSVSGKKPMRIYYFTVEGKMNLIPARRDSDGELGMYDLVSNTFFTNQGSGAFTAGPVLDVYIPSGN